MAIQAAKLASTVRRPHLYLVPQQELATVRDINSAPSRRRQHAALQAEEPSWARRPHAPRTSRVQAVTSPLHVAELVKWAALSFISIAVAVVVFMVSSDAYVAANLSEVTNYSVQAGDSLWSVAQGLQSSRPLADVVADIQLLNGGVTSLSIGQDLIVPVK